MIPQHFFFSYMRYLIADFFYSIVIFLGSLVSIDPFWCSYLSSFSTVSSPSSLNNIIPLFNPYWVRRVWCTWNNCSYTCSIACNYPYCIGRFWIWLDIRLYIPLHFPYLLFILLLIPSWCSSLIPPWNLLLVVLSMGVTCASCTSVSSLL